MADDVSGLVKKVQNLASEGWHEDTLLVLSNLGPETLYNHHALLSVYCNSLVKLGRWKEAGHAFENLATLMHDHRAEFLAAATRFYLQAQANDDAARIGPEALSLNPEDAALALAIGRTLIRRNEIGPLSDVIAHLQLSNAEQAHFKATCLRRLKRLDEAYDTLKAGWVLNPQDVALSVELYSHSRARGDFPAMRQFETLMTEPLSPFNHSIFTNQFALDRLYWLDDEARQALPSRDQVLLKKKTAHAPQQRQRRSISSAEQRLKIGYLSDEFGNFIVMEVLEDVLIAHDREKFDIRLISYTEPRSVVQRAENWPQFMQREVMDVRTLSDAEAARRISDEGIDILVDLKGYTRGARPQIAMMSDAAITATYLGYPASAAGAGFDYQITDRIVTPDSSKDNYEEKLCRLPETQMPNRAIDAVVIDPTSRAAEGLPENCVLLGAFNAPRKLNPRSFELWMRIMRDAPETALWINCNGVQARSALIGEAARHGVNGSRIYFMEGNVPFSRYLGRLALADLALDVMPYNGHSTTADILRAGVPVITTRGASYHSRVSWSLLKTLGLEDLAADDDEGYFKLAVAIATDSSRRRLLRLKVESRRQAAALFKPRRMARHLERAYILMAERARNGLPPDHIDVPSL